MPGNVAEDFSSAWAPDTHMGNDEKALGSRLQPNPTQVTAGFEEAEMKDSHSRSHLGSPMLSLSLPHSLSILISLSLSLSASFSLSSVLCLSSRSFYRAFATVLNNGRPSSPSSLLPTQRINSFEA